MFLDLCTLILGLALLLSGGEFLVRGASALSRALGVPPIIIGLTVVSLGTSTPELMVNLFAVLQNESELSFGNIFGSNLANIGLIIGCTALITPLSVSKRIVVRELPIMLAITIVALFLALGISIDRGPTSLDRYDGIILLLLMVIFLYYTVSGAMSDRYSKSRSLSEKRAGYRSAGIALLGLLALIWGANLTVKGGVGLANAAGVPEVIVGLTIIAIGTSLPELTASVIAAMRGHPDIAIGNVIGSNILNIVLVAGVCASIQPILVPNRGFLDLTAVLALSLILWVMTANKRNLIQRGSGILLLLIYLTYIGWRSLY